MINPMELTNRTVLVTGASSGIGRETAILLSQLGARIVLVARNPEQLEKTHSLLNGQNHLQELFDLRDVDEIPRWMQRIVEKTGPLQGLVHCAGMRTTKPLKLITADEINSVISINVSASFGLSKGFRQKSVCPNGGSIVLISSIMGVVGESGTSTYSASKGALISLVKSLALELTRDKIRINCVAPAIVHTEMSEKLRSILTTEQYEKIEAMHPLGIGEPRDVANAIAYLLADTGKWITGTTLIIDGGYSAH